MAASVFTIEGADLGKGGKGERCKCVRNPRTKKSQLLCFVGKSKKHRSGWKFTKDTAARCR